MASSRLKFIAKFLPLVLGPVVLIAIFYLKDLSLDEVLSQIQEVGAGTAFLILGLTLLALCVQAARLALLYSCGSHSASWRQAFRALLIGLLYGNVIPAGQVGGDPIKAFYLAKLTEGRNSHALTAVIVDRALGLVVLAALAGAGILFGAVEIADARLKWALLSVFMAGALLTLLLLSSRLRRGTGFSALLRILPMADRRAKITAALKEVSASPMRVAIALGLSLFSHLALIAAVFVVSVSLGLGLPFLDFVAKVPVANVAASLPFSPPGGWGVGESVYLLLFPTIASSATLMLSAMPRLAMLFCSLWGVPASWRLPKRPTLDESSTSEQEGASRA